MHDHHVLVVGDDTPPGGREVADDMNERLGVCLRVEPVVPEMHCLRLACPISLDEKYLEAELAVT